MKALTLVFFLCACGGKSDAPVQSPQPDESNAKADVGSEPIKQPTPTADMLSSEECEALFNHVFDVAFTAQQAELPPEERPTQADVETAKARMRDQLLPECSTKTREELQYECIMKSADRNAFQACYPAQEADPEPSSP